LSTHRQTDFTLLTIPLSAPSMIYESKTVRGFFLYHWFATTPPQRIRRDLAAVISLVEKSSMVIPEGQPMPGRSDRPWRQTTAGVLTTTHGVAVSRKESGSTGVLGDPADGRGAGAPRMETCPSSGYSRT
jgi:hypothetical protein